MRHIDRELKLWVVKLEKTEANSAEHQPVAAPFHPQDVLVVGFLACATVIAVPALFGHLDVQTLAMERGRTGLAAQQTAP